MQIAMLEHDNQSLSEDELLSIANEKLRDDDEIMVRKRENFG